MNKQGQTEFVEFSKLRLADRIRLPGGGAFMDAIVKQINADRSVTVERPFMLNQDFSYGAEPCVIVTIGHEDVTLSSGVVELIERNRIPLK